MAQRPGPSRKRAYPAGNEQMPQQSHRDLPLVDGNGIIAENLVRRMNCEINDRDMNKDEKNNFAEKVADLTWKSFLERLNKKNLTLKNAQAQRDTAMFQVYDWLMLSKQDQDAVLAGNQPDGYFEKLFRRSRYNVTSPNLPLASVHDNTIIVPNVVKRLQYELQYNIWTRSQFGFRVFGEVGIGQAVETMMDYERHSYASSYYEEVKKWLELSKEQRQDLMNGIRHPIQPVPIAPMSSDELRQDQEAAQHLDFRAAHLNFLANPCDATLNVPGFRTCMLRIAEEDLEIMKRELARTRGAPDKRSQDRYWAANSLKRYTEQLIQFLTTHEKLQRGSSMTCLMITLAFRIGFRYDWEKLGECLNHLLEGNTQKKSQFAKNVVECSDEELELMLTSTEQYFMIGSHLYHLQKVYDHLLMGVHKRWLNLVLETKATVGKIGRSNSN